LHCVTAFAAATEADLPKILQVAKRDSLVQDSHAEVAQLLKVVDTAAAATPSVLIDAVAARGS